MLTAHLFCATSPAIEDTDLQISLLRMNYNSYKEQIYASGLSPFLNRWNQVHNFTPESGSFTIIQDQGIPNSVDNEVVDRFKTLLDNRSTHGLSIEPRNSAIFELETEGRDTHLEKRSLFVVRQNAPTKDSDIIKFYREIELIIDKLKNGSNRIISIIDVDIKPGELRLPNSNDYKTGNHQKKNLSKTVDYGGKLIAIEAHGIDAQTLLESITTMETKDIDIELIEEHLVDCYRTKLQRLFEINRAV